MQHSLVSLYYTCHDVKTDEKSLNWKNVNPFIEVSCWTITGERQAVRIRNLYLKAILRQDIGYFETETTTGEIMERMSSDTDIIQDAIGEKVSYTIKHNLNVDKLNMTC